MGLGRRRLRTVSDMSEATIRNSSRWWNDRLKRYIKSVVLDCPFMRFGERVRDERERTSCQNNAFPISEAADDTSI